MRYADVFKDHFHLKYDFVDVTAAAAVATAVVLRSFSLYTRGGR